MASDPQPSLTLPLDSPATDLATAGGKGHNLAVLSRAGRSGDGSGSGSGIVVPPGFVVTVTAYRAFLDQDGGQLVKEIEDALANYKDKDEGHAQLEEASAAIRAAFPTHPLSDALRAEIDGRLSDLVPSAQAEQVPIYYAVRSSATCEDMPDASFAGQHDTYLNVPSTDVCDRIVDCFSSLFTARAIAYRARCELSHVHAGMAVVVQAMASSTQKSSGVLFTANPLTGRRQECVLEAIPGLGEALVSGLAEPDRYVVSKGRAGRDVDIKDVRVGAKAKAILSVEGGGVTDETLSTAEGSTVLTDGDVKKIIEIGQEIEALYDGTPQDIEWSMDGQQVYIVQSRPITTLFPLPDVPPEPLQVFFSFNAVQGIIAPIYPFGQDALRTIMSGVIRWISWGRFGNEGSFLLPVAERLYVNVTPPLRNSVGRKILGKILPAIEPGIASALDGLLDHPDLSVKSGMGPTLFLRMASLASVVVPRYLFSIMMPDWSRKRLIHQINDFVEQIETKAEKVEGLANLMAFERETFDAFFPCILPQAIPRMAVAMSSLVKLTELASSLPDGNDLVLTVTRGLPHNVTTEMDLKLWQVAKSIQNDSESLEHFTSTNADALAEDYLVGRLPHSAQNAVRNFMDEYGMRGLYEIDFGRPRWREDPTPLMNSLKSYVEINEAHAPDKVFAAGEVAAEEAIQQLGEKLGKPWLVSFLARRVRSIAGVRELPKFTIIRIMGVLRGKMLQEGAKLVDQGVIDDARDLFFLQMEELEALASGELKDCKDIIRERKAAMDREDERTRFPRVIASDGFAHYGGAASTANAKEGSNTLCGEPVSPGTYEGRIHVVHDPSKAKLSQGEVLCCHGTDPSWTPLFLSAGALVMEVGGLMTHGSVVAREYGIPAVVGLEKVTERLVTGQRVRVDGSSGIVEILDE